MKSTAKALSKPRFRVGEYVRLKLPDAPLMIVADIMMTFSAPEEPDGLPRGGTTKRVPKDWMFTCRYVSSNGSLHTFNATTSMLDAVPAEEVEVEQQLRAQAQWHL